MCAIIKEKGTKAERDPNPNANIKPYPNPKIQCWGTTRHVLLKYNFRSSTRRENKVGCEINWCTTCAELQHKECYDHEN